MQGQCKIHLILLIHTLSSLYLVFNNITAGLNARKAAKCRRTQKQEAEEVSFHVKGKNKPKNDFNFQFEKHDSWYF